MCVAETRELLLWPMPDGLEELQLQLLELDRFQRLPSAHNLELACNLLGSG